MISRAEFNAVVDRLTETDRVVVVEFLTQEKKEAYSRGRNAGNDEVRYQSRGQDMGQ